MNSLFLIALLPLLILSCSSQEKPQEEQVLWGFAADGYPIQNKTFRQIEKETHLTPLFFIFYLQWSSKHQESLKTTLETIWNMGAVPCLTWEPVEEKNDHLTTIRYEEILNGKYDTYLHEVAQIIKEWGKQLIIRFAHEMNTSQYHWGTSEEGYGPKSPEIYIKMFRYVVDLFKHSGVKNVSWAFCPNSDSVPYPDQSAPWNTVDHYYPGSDYVDVLGMDGYNWGESHQENPQPLWLSWRSFEEIFEPLYKQLKALAPEKPILVFEMSTSGDPQDRYEWIKQAFLVSNQWKLRALVWFQVNKEKDWRLMEESDQKALNFIRTSLSPSQAWIKNFTPSKTSRKSSQSD